MQVISTISRCYPPFVFILFTIYIYSQCPGIFCKFTSITSTSKELVWLVCNELDFDTATKLPQVSLCLFSLFVQQRRATWNFHWPGLSVSVPWDGKPHILERRGRVNSSSTSIITIGSVFILLSVSVSWSLCFCENIFNRNLDLGSLEKNVENQPKFFANSMKVPLFLSQYTYFWYYETNASMSKACLARGSLRLTTRSRCSPPICSTKPRWTFSPPWSNLDISFRWYTWAAMLRIFACLHSTMRGLMLRFQSKQFFKESAPYILCCWRWAQAFKEGEVMIGNWFEHMKEVKKDEQWLLVMFFFSSLSAMRHFRRILLWCIILRWIALTL